MQDRRNSSSPDLQLQTVESTHLNAPDSLPSDSVQTESISWVSVFNTSILTTKVTKEGPATQELGLLMKKPEFQSLLKAAQFLAEQQSLSPEEATERLIRTFRQIDQAWQQIVNARGLSALIEEKD